MPQLHAGATRIAFQPRIGTNLVGYAKTQETVGIHDPIHARALVLDDGQHIIALCSIEVCLFLTDDVAQIRTLIAERQPALQPENIFLFATHTHAAPALFEPDNWVRSPLDTIADAVVQAYEQRQPAQVGMGYGQLYGYSINRRFLDRPVDPSVSVIRVDSQTGTPMAVLGTFGNHAVVLGSDNSYVSGDWPGQASLRLEAEFGGDFVALFSQGGAGDINPLTETVRQRLNAGHTVSAIGNTSTMYGQPDGYRKNAWNIEDRAGGTFIEAETIALAYNAELKRVWPTIETTSDINLWTERVTVDAAPGDDEPSLPAPSDGITSSERFQRLRAGIMSGQYKPEIMMLGIGEAIIVGQPGETFSENAVAFRKLGQQMGISHPVLISYANGWFAYLTPENAYAEGGYEVAVAQGLGLSRRIQDRIAAAIQPLLERVVEQKAR